MNYSYNETNRVGDHIWWVSDVQKFQSHYPDWKLTYDVPRICREIHENNVTRWLETATP
jgi:CDP-paratose 2-epimerase